MSNKFELEESLSALMDNEVDDLELRRILKALPEDEKLQKTWESYHLISAAIKQETHSSHSVDILSAIQSELKDEPIPSHANKSIIKKYQGFITSLGQGAIAASVALAVLFTANSITNTSPSSSAGIEIASLIETTPSTLIFNGEYTASEFSRVASFDGSKEDAINERLKEAIYEEFQESPEASEVQVNYTTSSNANNPNND